MVVRAKNLKQLNVSRSIRRIAYDRLAKVVPKIEAKMKRKLEDEMEMAFTDSLVAQEMEGGNLQGELGLTDPGGKKRAIAEAMRESVTTEVDVPRGGIRKLIKPIIRVKTMRNDFKELLKLPEASQAWTDAKFTRVKGPPLPWLSWLLLRGRNTVVRGARLVRGKKGRSTLDYTMSSNTPAGTWKVPPEFSGTPNNNFLTRNLDARIPAIRKFFLATIDNALKGLRRGGR